LFHRLLVFCYLLLVVGCLFFALDEIGCSPERGQKLGLRMDSRKAAQSHRAKAFQPERVNLSFWRVNSHQVPITNNQQPITNNKQPIAIASQQFSRESNNFLKTQAIDPDSIRKYESGLTLTGD
jgi:hypothetical protein